MSSNNSQTPKITPEKRSSEVFQSTLFGQLFEADKNRLYSYIYAYVTDTTAADDIFQETCLTLWKEFAKFEQGTNFSKWANGIAFNRIRVFRRNQNKYDLGLTDDFLQEFRENISIIESNYVSQEKKWRHLEHCRTKLSSSFQQIYHSFYVKNLMAQEIAESTGRSVFAIRKVIHKVRKQLFDCVENKINEDAS